MLYQEKSGNPAAMSKYLFFWERPIFAEKIRKLQVFVVLKKV
jgi:hypothetical protein